MVLSNKSTRGWQKEARHQHHTKYMIVLSLSRRDSPRYLSRGPAPVFDFMFFHATPSTYCGTSSLVFIHVPMQKRRGFLNLKIPWLDVFKLAPIFRMRTIHIASFLSAPSSLGLLAFRNRRAIPPCQRSCIRGI